MKRYLVAMRWAYCTYRRSLRHSKDGNTHATMACIAFSGDSGASVAVVGKMPHSLRGYFLRSIVTHLISSLEIDTEDEMFDDPREMVKQTPEMPQA